MKASAQRRSRAGCRALGAWRGVDLPLQWQRGRGRPGVQSCSSCATRRVRRISAITRLFRLFMKRSAKSLTLASQCWRRTSPTLVWRPPSPAARMRRRGRLWRCRCPFQRIRARSSTASARAELAAAAPHAFEPQAKEKPASLVASMRNMLSRSQKAEAVPVAPAAQVTTEFRNPSFLDETRARLPLPCLPDDLAADLPLEPGTRQPKR